MPVEKVAVIGPLSFLKTKTKNLMKLKERRRRTNGITSARVFVISLM